ncbi:hypothetical protein CEXT_414431 [Caerostris extrusa]|uniref:Uncharacterized protein n=1 Tax=Caerostris extrusa TaxID=172846 RepID=A0AAV4NRJ0_CAEEX|nr:hypothetical protein CEXT_414431 [Caerostris extrusa]
METYFSLDANSKFRYELKFIEKCKEPKKCLFFSQKKVAITLFRNSYFIRIWCRRGAIGVFWIQRDDAKNPILLPTCVFPHKLARKRKKVDMLFPEFCFRFHIAFQHEARLDLYLA